MADPKPGTKAFYAAQAKAAGVYVPKDATAMQIKDAIRKHGVAERRRAARTKQMNKTFGWGEYAPKPAPNAGVNPNRLAGPQSVPSVSATDRTTWRGRLNTDYMRNNGGRMPPAGMSNAQIMAANQAAARRSPISPARASAALLPAMAVIQAGGAYNAARAAGKGRGAAAGEAAMTAAPTAALAATPALASERFARAGKAVTNVGKGLFAAGGDGLLLAASGGASALPGAAVTGTGLAMRGLNMAAKVVGKVALPAALAYGGTMGAMKDGNRVRGAARGALEMMDPTELFMERGIAERAFDAIFGRAKPAGQMQAAMAANKTPAVGSMARPTGGSPVGSPKAYLNDGAKAKAAKAPATQKASKVRGAAASGQAGGPRGFANKAVQKAAQDARRRAGYRRSS